MSFLDDEEYEKGGIEMNAAARAALMQKLSQTHSAGMYGIMLKISHKFMYIICKSRLLMMLGNNQANSSNQLTLVILSEE